MYPTNHNIQLILRNSLECRINSKRCPTPSNRGVPTAEKLANTQFLVSLLVLDKKIINK